MRRLPPEPQVGDRITAELVRELMRCIRERQLLKGPNYTTSTSPNGTYIKLDLPKRQIFPREPHPFEVRWSASANDGAGAWVIWLPDTSSLVHVGNAYISSIANIVAEAALPAGWYRASTVTPTSTAVWLNITTYTMTGQVFLDISDSEGQSATGSVRVPLLIATMTTDAQTGAKRVKQFIDSAITFGGSGGGGGGLTGTVEFVADVDWYVDGSVHQLRKRLRVLDLATGKVTDKANTTYANGWEVAADSTPITAIIN